MILSPDFLIFIEKNIAEDPLKLRLKYHGHPDLDFAITQIECRKKFAKKLPVTLRRSQWLFPNVIAGEQCTSDAIADFHASLIRDGERVVDLTAGLGVDCLHLSGKASCVTAVEIDPFKAEVLTHNMPEDKVKVICADCREYVAQYRGEKLDTIFIDPARRAADGSRVYSLADCEPNVVDMLPRLSEITRRLIIKMSPMLDISHTAELLPGVERIIALGNTTECKELVAVLNFEKMPERYIIEAVTLTADGRINKLSFTREENVEAVPCFAMPKNGDYVYMPYPAVMKAAPFNLLSDMYQMPLLHANTHLYTSADLKDAFPGLAMRIDEMLPFASSVIKRLSREHKILNITCRNFGMSAEVLRRKLKVKDGGEQRLFAVTCSDDKEYFIMASPLNSK